jgi:hypothetical protein
MHYSRIKFYYTEKDLPKGPEDSGEELDEQAGEQSVNYYKVARAAAAMLRVADCYGWDGVRLPKMANSPSR